MKKLSLKMFDLFGETHFYSTASNSLLEMVGPDVELFDTKWTSNKEFYELVERVSREFNCSDGVANVWLTHQHLEGFDCNTIPELLSEKDIELVVSKAPSNCGRVYFTSAWFRLGCPPAYVWSNLESPNYARNLRHAQALTRGLRQFGYSCLEGMLQYPEWEKAKTKEDFYLTIGGFRRLGKEVLSGYSKEVRKAVTCGGLVQNLKGNIRALRAVCEFFTERPDLIEHLRAVSELSDEMVTHLANRHYRKVFGAGVAFSRVGTNLFNGYSRGYSAVVYDPKVIGVKLHNQFVELLDGKWCADTEIHVILHLLGNEALKNEECRSIHSFVNTYRIPVYVLDEHLHKFNQKWNQFFSKHPETMQYWRDCVELAEPPKSIQAFRKWLDTLYCDVPHSDKLLWSGVERADLRSAYADSVEYSPKSRDILPEVSIVDSQYELSRLPTGDISHLFVGMAADCCQHLYGAGRSCAIHSYTEETSTTYVLTKKGGAVAISWVWVDGAKVVLDSVEAKRGITTDRLCSMWVELAKILGAKGYRVFIGDTDYGCTKEIIKHLKESGYIKGSSKETATLKGYNGYMDGREHFEII